MDLAQPNKRGYHNPKMEGRIWEWEKWRGECANGMDERCEANLLIASVRPAVGRAVFIIREHAIFLEEGYFIPVKLSLVDVKLVQHVKEATRKVRETNVQRQKFIDDGDFCDRVAF